MIVYLYLAIVMVVGYFLGNINFARIFSRKLGKQEITEIGSKNPGTMNMLRTQGLGRALLTLACEALKVGLPALACFFIFEHFFEGYANLAYFLSALSGILGHCFPVIYKFKGGKGVACTFGMFLFHPHSWWVSLIMFVACFFLFMFIEYPFIISLTFILTMTIYETCYLILNHVIMWVPIVSVLWLNFVWILFMHRGNIKRLMHGKENKVNFREKVFKKKTKVKVESDEALPISAVEAGEEVVKENTLNEIEEEKEED